MAMTKSTKVLNNLTKNILNYAKTYNVNALIRTIKKNPINVINECLNLIDDIPAIIFILVSATKTKSKILLLGLSFDKIEEVFKTAKANELKIILKGLWPDQIFQLMEEHKNWVKEILLNIDSDTRQEVKKISKYEEDEVGHIMNPEFLSLNKDWTINKCLKIIKQERTNIEQTSTLYIVDNNELFGVIKLQDIFFAEKYNEKIGNICDHNPIYITHKGSIDEVIKLFDKYNIDSIAVCGNDKTIKGIVKNSDIVQAIQEETTDDIYKMYGMSDLSFPYLSAPIKNIIKSRIFWLIILMISATITSFVIDRFQVLGQDLTNGLSTALLVPIIPVLTGTSGNAGSQSSASIIRALSIGDITSREYFRAIKKEVFVGFLVGLILAIVNFIRLLIYYSILFNDHPNDIPGINWNNIEWFSKRLIIACSTSVTLFIAIILSKLLGSALPIIAMKLKIDPSVMSAPILATILDVTTTTLLFGIGLGITLLL